MKLLCSVIVVFVLFLVMGAGACDGVWAIDVGMKILSDVAGLNSEVNDRYGNDSGDVLVIIGGHGYGVFEGLVIGAEGAGFLNYYNTDYERLNSAYPTGIEEGSLSLNGGYGAINVGWDADYSYAIKTIPMIVLGYGGMSVSSNPRNTGMYIPSSEYDEEDIRIASQGCFVAGAKVDSQYRFNFSHKEGRRNGLVLGLVAGYQQWMMPTRWSVNHTDLNNLSEATFSGPYLTLSIGWYGERD